MQKRKANKTESNPSQCDWREQFRWRTLWRWESVLTVMFAGVIAWLIMGWATGQWLRSTASPEEIPKGQTATPGLISRQVLASLPRAVQQKAESWNSFIAANFAGDQACAECHPSEYEAHIRSGHSHTAMLMNETSVAVKLSNQKIYQDTRRDQQFEFAQKNGQFWVRDTSHAAEKSLPVTWLLGSGHHAQTPIAVDEVSQRGVELRWSYFPQDNRVGLTPDHERFDDFAADTIECFGRPMTDSDLRACLGCHSTSMPPPELPLINSMIVANVGCERCHGPRKKHVELAHLGRAEEVKPLLQYETAVQYMAACANCHRDASAITPDMTPEELARFQPYGIQRSKCYLNSPDKLTCSTCHDPHDTVSHDRSRSIAQCNQCHENGTLSTPSHQPGGDCIECHMPLMPWKAGIAFHDHRIRILSNAKSNEL